MANLRKIAVFLVHLTLSSNSGIPSGFFQRSGIRGFTSMWYSYILIDSYTETDQNFRPGMSFFFPDYYRWWAVLVLGQCCYCGSNFFTSYKLIIYWGIRKTGDATKGKPNLKWGLDSSAQYGFIANNVSSYKNQRHVKTRHFVLYH